jgi:hypothetical protein
MDPLTDGQRFAYEIPSSSILAYIVFRTLDLIINPMGLSRILEAVSYSTTEEFLNILWNPKVHDRVHKGPPLVPGLS